MPFLKEMMKMRRYAIKTPCRETRVVCINDRLRMLSNDPDLVATGIATDITRDDKELLFPMLLVSHLLIFGIQRHPVIQLHTFQEQHLQRGLPTYLAHETL
jgi:hypothetical protein